MAVVTQQEQGKAADTLKDKRVELVLQQLEELPTLPAVAIRVLEATSNDDSSAKEVVALIASDPSLTTRILKLVHRADAGVRAEVNSVERAVVLLGFDAVRSAVLAVSLFETFPVGEPRSTMQAANVPKGGTPSTSMFDREQFWKHSIAVASCCELLAKKVAGVWGRESKVDPSEAFVCGLLHDLGKVALEAALPKSFAKVVEATEMLRGNIADLERQIIGLDHMVVGKRLAEKWKLPVNVRDCVWLHGQVPGALPATVRNPRLVNLVTLADTLVREQHLGYSGNHTYGVPRKALLEGAGVTEEQVAVVMGELVGMIEVRASALGLGESSTSDLYRQALSQANRELGRVSTQLAVRNRKLAVRAKFFDALAEFHGAVSADAAPSMVLRAVAETAVEALDVGAAAAFSLPPGQNCAEVVVFVKGGEAESMVVEAAERPQSPSGGPGAVAMSGDELAFVLPSVSPRLTGVRRYWVALMADGVCVGGVVWGSMSGEGSEEVDRLAAMKTEMTGLASGWSLALRTSQIRDESRLLSEQLAEANRNLQDAQSEVTRARTLVTIAEMAAGAAHEMNNPLAVISGRSQLLAATLTDEKSKKSAQLIAEQTHRLSGMITELMEFAKPEPPKVLSTAVIEIVMAGVEQAKARPGLADRRIEVPSFDVPLVRVDPGQTAAAIAEVLDNALQATDQGKGGRVSVSAAHDPFGGHVVVTVSDNGTGMDENTLRRAFDPFFSSKPAGRRRGMGLAKAMRWIEAVGGAIRLDSRPGEGTRALLLLPVERGAVIDTEAGRRVAG